MEIFDQAWDLLKAVRFDTQGGRGSMPFKAYRVIPRKYLDEVLSEGLFPRDASQWNRIGVPDLTSRQMRNMPRDALITYLNYHNDNVLHSFMQLRPLYTF